MSDMKLSERMQEWDRQSAVWASLVRALEAELELWKDRAMTKAAREDAVESDLENYKKAFRLEIEANKHNFEAWQKARAERDAIRLATLRECQRACLEKGKSFSNMSHAYAAIQALIDAEVNK